jgi:hypothetical protein
MVRLRRLHGAGRVARAVGVHGAVQVHHLRVRGHAADAGQRFDAVGYHGDEPGAHDAFQHELVEVGGQDRVDVPLGDQLAQAEVEPVDPARPAHGLVDDLLLLAGIGIVALEEVSVRVLPSDRLFEVLVLPQPRQRAFGIIARLLPVAVLPRQPYDCGFHDGACQRDTRGERASGAHQEDGASPRSFAPAALQRPGHVRDLSHAGQVALQHSRDPPDTGG